MIIKQVSQLTQGEMIRIVSMKAPQIMALLARLPYRGRLQLRRDIQIALTRFSGGKPILNVSEGQHVLTNNRREVLNNDHAIQLRALRVCQLIENNVRDAYMNAMRGKIIMRYPEFAKNPKKVKSLTKLKWRKYLAKTSY